MHGNFWPLLTVAVIGSLVVVALTMSSPRLRRIARGDNALPAETRLNNLLRHWERTGVPTQKQVARLQKLESQSQLPDCLNQTRLDNLDLVRRRLTEAITPEESTSN